jgi:hypothetical protein
MSKLTTKKVVVNGQEVVLSSIDGRSWFLKPESMYDFERRLRQDPKTDEEFDDLGLEMAAEDPTTVQTT